MKVSSLYCVFTAGSIPQVLFHCCKKCMGDSITGEHDASVTNIWIKLSFD